MPALSRGQDVGRAALLTTAVTAWFAVLAWGVLEPNAIYSVDTAVKYIQARSLWESAWRSQAFDEPAEYIDPSRDFQVLSRPYVFLARGRYQSIFPTAWAALTAPLAPWGLAGITLASVLAAAWLLWTTWRLGRDGPVPWLLPAVMGLATTTWFYAALPTEHALAAALTTTACQVALSRREPRGAAIAGALCGLAAIFRDEAMLIAPGLAWARFHVHGTDRRSALRDAARIGGALAIVVALSGVLDVQVYRRPLLAHLQHALGSLAVWLPGPTAPALPYLEDLGPARRFEVVAHEWLIGTGTPVGWAIAAAALAGGWWIRRRSGSALALAAVLAVLIVLWGADTWDAVRAPKFIGGLYRLSPFLIFALLPLPPGVRATPARRLALVTAPIFLAITLATLNTTGGKGLGPRLLLPLLPLLVVAAWEGIVRWWDGRAERGGDGLVGLLGLVLVAGSIVLELAGPVRAYAERTWSERAALDIVIALGDAPPSSPLIVVRQTDDFHIVGSQYYDRRIVMAGTPARAAALAERFAGAQVPAFVAIARLNEVPVDFPGYARSARVEEGRWVIERWAR